MSNERNDGGPAFPVKDHIYGPNGSAPAAGLSIRDWFAGQFAAGAMASPSTYVGQRPEDRENSVLDIAGFAYLAADAMLAAREVRS
jgi:hypothetical protein